MVEKKTDCKNSGPKVSVIIPVYNAEKYLNESLDSILAQTLTDIEIICVDDGSTDSSSAILEQYAKEDGRITVLQQNNKGAGAARNLGMKCATGKYFYFFDADDKCDPTMLEETVSIAEKVSADIVAFNFYRFFEDGTERKISGGIHINFLPKDVTVFNYNECPDRILSVINPTPWNKIFNAEFVRSHSLQYEEISSSNDITFCAVCSAYAERIAYTTKAFLHYRVGYINTITSSKHKNLTNVITAVSSVIQQVKKLPYCYDILRSVQFFAIDNFIFALNHNVKDFNDEVCGQYYQWVHLFFNSSFCDTVTEEILKQQDLYNSFFIVKKHDYDTMKLLKSRKIIVSLTSYPARIQGVSTVLKSILSQTLPADEIVLWLAESQFAGKEADLPEELVQMEKENNVQIRWCDDLKPHKKYFYSMQEYPDDLVVTIDDDVIYSSKTLENLYYSYLMHPDAVSANRAHLMIVDEHGKLLPYNDWIRETDGCRWQPSMQLFAVGVGGVLYPPHLLHQDLFQKQVIIDNCIYADDLWLKAMEVVNQIPVVVASEYVQLQYVPGSQEEALWRTNTSDEENLNDLQLANIIVWLDQRFEKNIFIDGLTKSETGVQLLGIRSLCQHFVAERNNLRRRYHSAVRNENRINTRFQLVYAEKNEIKDKWKTSDAIKAEVYGKLRREYAIKADLNARLKRVYAERDERSAQIKDLKAQLKAAKKAQADLKKQLGQTKKQLKASKKQNAAIKRSTSYRLGRILTWPVRKLKSLLRGLRKGKKQK